jgi:hypothetical protein
VGEGGEASRREERMRREEESRIKKRRELKTSGEKNSRVFPSRSNVYSVGNQRSGRNSKRIKHKKIKITCLSFPLQYLFRRKLKFRWRH